MDKLIAKYLSLNFEGYFMCRLATDPDPTDDVRGTSGYTMALQGEPDLDQMVRLQPADDMPPLRQPADSLNISIGVSVRNVTYDGKPSARGTELLQGATVNLLDTTKASPYHGVTFVSRNNVVGSDDTLAMLVEPFELSITKQIDDHTYEIFATDHLDPANPGKRSWEIDQPRIYSRRLPISFTSDSDEAHQAISVYDEYGYFRDRRRWLTQQVERKQHELKAPDADIESIQAEIQNYKTRIFQIESWGDRVSNKLGFRAEWSFLINGERSIRKVQNGQAESAFEDLEQMLDVKIDREQMWPIRFWFGGWDGDLLTGYTRGALDLPVYRNV
ncbi:MAG: hypothetical protein AAF639_29840 [Chloroflexota bacterium]